MENHELAIGIMKTACSVAAYPQAVAPLRTRLERSVVGPFPAQLAKAAEPVLHGRNGVVRIRNLKLDLAHHGEWDVQTLAALIAGNYIDNTLTGGATRNNYILNERGVTAVNWDYTAIPNGGLTSGDNSYCISDDFVVRFLAGLAAPAKYAGTPIG